MHCDIVDSYNKANEDLNPFCIMQNYVKAGNKLTSELREEVIDWIIEEFIDTDREYDTLDTSLYHLYKHGNRGLKSLSDQELILEAMQVDDADLEGSFNYKVETSTFYSILTRHFTPIDFFKMIKEYS